jgi:hypothetical protein
VSRSEDRWSPRGRIRPKDTRRECARDLTVPAMDFGLESTLSMVGRAVRGRCSRRAVQVGEADLEGGGEWCSGGDGGREGFAAATSGLERWACGSRVAAREDEGVGRAADR